MTDSLGIFVGLGANLGERTATLDAARAELTADGRITERCCSRYHETEPVGGPAGQPWFLNAVAELATDLPAEDLLERLLAVEERHGRRRGMANGPRTLDLDLLLYHDLRLTTARLTVPHPRMGVRAFVLAPLREICSAERYEKILRLTAVSGR